MATTRAGIVLRQLRTFFSTTPGGQPSDRELLHRFAAERDEAAFTALVQRHGAMVRNVCLRILHDWHDAEDAFQATFLTLARKAASPFWQVSVAGWLHLVAHRLALKARRNPSSFSLQPTDDAVDPSADPLQAVSGRELCALLDDELHRLPERYRSPLVLCCLEGATRDEAARALGWSCATLKRRLERGRALLRQRLLRRGLQLATALGSVLLTDKALHASVPSLPVETIVRAIMRTVAGGAFPTAGVSARVVALSEGVLKHMFVTRVKQLLVLLMTLVVLAAGTGIALHRAGAARLDEGPQPDVPKAAGQPAAEPRATVDRHGDALPSGAVGRLGTVRFRHEGWVQGVAFSPDGRLMATAGGKVVALWDADSGKPRGRLTGHERDINCLAWSSDGKFLVSGSADNTLRLWDASAGRELRHWQANQGGDGPPEFGGVLGVVFAPDNRTVIARGSDKTLRAWDATTGQELRQFKGHPGAVLSLALSPDGKLLAAGVDDPAHPVRLWETATGKEVRQLAGPAPVHGLAFAPDGKALGAGFGEYGKPGEVKVWDVAGGQELLSLKGHKGGVATVAFSSDGKTLVSGSYDKTLRLWDAATGQELRQLGPHEVPIHHVAFVPDGKRLISWGTRQAPQFWDLATGKEQPPFDGHDMFLASIAFSPDGRLLASAAIGPVLLWDVAARKELRRLEGHGGNVTGVAFSGDGKTLASSGADGTLRLWDVSTGNALRKIEGQGRWLNCLAFAPDGKTVAAWGEENAGAIVLWDPATGKELRHLDLPLQPKASIRSLVFSPDGKTLVAASGTDTFVRLWEVASGKELPHPAEQHGGLTCVAFSADGRLLASACLDHTFSLFDIATGQERLSVQHGGYVTSLAFSPDGNLLASANDGTHHHSGGNQQTTGNEGADQVHLWDVTTGKELHHFAGQQGSVFGLAFSPDGALIASGGRDTTTLLWDVAGWKAGRRRGD